ncbi:MAG: YceK/YidQ family lipoprotein [Kiritimatiellae bacterium]|nr:YceK/YidQ family lipoprotein [Kiritimatiellia bacterium]MCO5062054.1 YceK/YidQ family lipoprotein [Kiritimatiellia bacterium]MCO5069253.1 YceK/YidQ family lipoprotein [Kiritimatiellia bacterium]
MIRTIIACAGGIAVSLMLTGCGTFMMRVVDAKAPREFLYPATHADVKMMKWFLKPDGTIITSKSYVGAGLCVVDMPISAVFDTLLLPIDMIELHDFRTKEAARSAKMNTVEQAGSKSGPRD